MNANLRLSSIEFSVSEAAQAKRKNRTLTIFCRRKMKTQVKRICALQIVLTYGASLRSEKSQI